MKSRVNKPISLLLAVMMIAGLITAMPIAVAAQEDYVISFYDPDDEYDTPLYNPEDIAAINAMIFKNSLNWTEAPGDGSSIPDDWTGVSWTYYYYGDEDDQGMRIYSVDVQGLGLSGALELRGLPSLNSLNVSGNNLSSISLFWLPELYMLDARNNILTTLDIDYTPSLSQMRLSSNNFTSLSIYPLTGDYEALEYLDLSFNPDLIYLEIGSLPNLEYLISSYCNLAGITMSDLPMLKYLDLSNNSMRDNLGVRNFPSLEQLYVRDTYMAGLHLSGLPSLKILDCSSSRNLFTMDLSALTALERFSCSHARFTSLSLEGLSNLSNISITQAMLTSLDLSGQPSTGYYYLSPSSLFYPNHFERLVFPGGYSLAFERNPSGSGSVGLTQFVWDDNQASLHIQANPWYLERFYGWESIGLDKPLVEPTRFLELFEYEPQNDVTIIAHFAEFDVHACTPVTDSKAATCTEEGYEKVYCSVCSGVISNTVIPAIGHGWGTGVVTKPATEYEDGEMTYTCGRCGDKRTESIPALGHTHSFTSVITAPTCTTHGYTTHTCSCSESYTSSHTAVLGHNFTESVEKQTATCETDGYDTLKCSRCDETDTVIIQATGHDWSSVVTAPTCTYPGYTTHFCACSESYIDALTAVLGHDWDDGEVTKPATETETGIMTYTCQRCDEKRTEIIPAADSVEVNGVMIFVKVWDDVSILDIREMAPADIIKIFNSPGSEIEFDLAARSSIDIYVEAGWFKNVDKTMKIMTEKGEMTVKTKSLWNNSGKSRIIQIRDGTLSFRNQ